MSTTTCLRLSSPADTGAPGETSYWKYITGFFVHKGVMRQGVLWPKSHLPQRRAVGRANLISISQ